MLEWKGGQVETRVVGASRAAIDETLIACVVSAKIHAPVVTSVYHGSIQMRPAKKEGDGFSGYWGSFAVNYALVIELGSKPHIIKAAPGSALFWNGADHPVKKVNHPGTRAQHILTNAALQEYPKLISRIKGKLK